MNQNSDKKFSDGIRRRPAREDIPPHPERKSFPEDEEKTYKSESVEEISSPSAGFIIADAEEEMDSPEDIFSKKKEISKSSWGWVLGGALAGILVLVILLSTVFARVTVVLKPHAEKVEIKDISAALDTSVSRPLLAQKVIPAELLEFNKKNQEEFGSTGQKHIEDKARGQVKIFNSFSSSPQTLVQGTRFVADSGRLYRLVKTIVIPGAKIEEGKIVPEFIEAELEADQAGEEANAFKEVNLKIPGFKGTAKYEGFYAQAPSGFSGGFRGEARVISKEDLEKAEEEVTQKIFKELGQEILRKIPPDFKMLEALREIQITKLDAPRSDTRRDKFSVAAEARGRILIFRENDVFSLVRDLILNGDKTKEVVDNSANLRYEVNSTDFSKKKSGVVIKGNLKLKSVIPQEEIAGVLRGRKEGSILEILKGRPELASFNVSFFPPWLFTAPEDASKIRLVIQNP